MDNGHICLVTDGNYTNVNYDFMIHALLTKDWNADPNAPDVKLSVDNINVTLKFYVNTFQFDTFQEEDKARVIFFNCHKYLFSAMNDEDYYRGKYRYNNFHLPWGEFYRLDTNWQTDFPSNSTTLTDMNNIEVMHHYIFFFKENIFECIAQCYRVDFMK